MKDTDVSVAVIVGDNTYAGLCTILSLLNQTHAPKELVILENPLKGRRLTQEFPLLSSVLALHPTITKVIHTQKLALPLARQMCEDALSLSDLLMISDGDHYYPLDYLECAVESFASTSEFGYYGGAVACNTSSTGDLDQDGGSILLAFTDDYVAGGSHVYSSSFKGLWKTVADFTTGLGEDRMWRALCTDRGGSRIGVYQEHTIHHITTHSSSKYPQSWNPKLVAYCDEHLGKATHTDTI